MKLYIIMLSKFNERYQLKNVTHCDRINFIVNEFKLIE